MIRTARTSRQRDLPVVEERSPCDELGELAGPYRWDCPTLGEFIRRVEREFGHSVSGSGLDSTGAAADDLLSPSSVRALCKQIGVPPEDFGV